MTTSISANPWENNNSLVVAATLGKLEDVRLWLNVADASADDFLALFRAINNGHIECVKELIPVSNIELNIERAIARAAYSKQSECMALLLEYKTPNTDLCEALDASAHHNDCACLELLLAHIDAKINNSFALVTAINNRSYQAVELLLPISEPQDNTRILQIASNLPSPLFEQLIARIPNPDCTIINELFLRCVNGGDKNKVQALLPKVEVMYHDGRALRTALQYDDHAMAELLYDGSDLTLVLELLRQDPKTKEFQLHRLIELEEARRQNAVLKDAVDGVSTSHKPRKM